MDRKDEIKKLSFEEDDFMLNDNKIEETEKEDVIEEEDNMATINFPREKINEEIEKNKKESKTKKVKKEKCKKVKITSKRKNKKVFLAQAIFCSISILFVLGCMIFYGSRLIKYYKIYNPKTEDGKVIELIGASITNKATFVTSGEGLYKLGGVSIYKGSNVNNYLYYSNQMWRIISINSDGSIELVSDKYINAMNFNDKITTFSKSKLNKYLNEKYLNTLNKDLLVQTSYCEDEVEDIADITCNDIVSTDYVRLLGISELLNSKEDGLTYLNNDNDYWLYNTNDKKVWYTNGSNISPSNVDDGYLVKPVIRIKNSATLLSGTGTNDDPYIIEKENKNFEVGKYVKLGDDTWVIYEVNDDNISLALDNNLYSTHYFSKKSNKYDVEDTTNIAYYLNNTYLNSLSYKNIINNHIWNAGKYNNEEDLQVEAYVGMYNTSDIKIGNDDEIYYLLTPGNDKAVCFYNAGLYESKITLSRNIKPTININKLEIKSGNGSITNPYLLEV